MKKKNSRKIFLTIALFFAMSVTYAQLPSDVDEDPDDATDPLNPAPIGDYIVPMLLLGIATAYVLLRKKDAVQVS